MSDDMEMEDLRDVEPSLKYEEDDIVLRRNSISEPTLGAPTEATSPLGTEVHFISAMILPLSLMIGMGVISTPGSVVNSVGSYGTALVLWGLGAVMAFAGLHVYLELASRFPSRSGGDAVYLEQAYPRPPYLVSTVFAACSVLLGYSAAISATVFAEYTLHAFSVQVTAMKQKGIAVAMVTFALGLCGASTRWSLKVMNALGLVKVSSMAFIICTGIAVLCGVTRIQHPLENLSHPFSGSTWNANAIATGAIKVDWTFAGWNQAIFFLSEITSQSGAANARLPSASSVKIVRQASYVALVLASVIYLLVNLAFSAAVPKSTLKGSGSLIGVMFCESVYGVDSVIAKRLFPLMVALSCLGVMIAQALGRARVIRESARQGVLPYPEFLSSTWPFGTPGGPILLQWGLSILVVLILPATGQFSFLISAQVYPGLVFDALIAVAVWVLRRASPPDQANTFQASNVFVVLYLSKCISTLIMSWVPPEGGTAVNSMWYATYCVVGVVLLLVCLAYYLTWIFVLPRWGAYTMVLETVELKGGAVTNRFKKVPRGERLKESRGGEDMTPLLDGD